MTRLEISPFIYEIHAPKEDEVKESGATAAVQPKKLKEGDLKRGMRIKHTSLGEGRI